MLMIGLLILSVCFQMFDSKDETTAEEERVSRAVDRSNNAAWGKPNVYERKSYKPELSAQEEMDMLRRNRKLLEEKLRKEGKIK